jgi:hypothetical protein
LVFLSFIKLCRYLRVVHVRYKYLIINTEQISLRSASLIYKNNIIYGVYSNYYITKIRYGGYPSIKG